MGTVTKLIVLMALLFSSSAQAQYCLLPGRVPYSTDQPGITNFKLNTINRTSSNVESTSSVIVVTTDSTNLVAGQTYTVTITHSKDPINFPTARNNIRVWIDYNHNYSFNDAGETVISVNFDTPGVYTGTFTIPSTAPLGNARLRATAKMSSDAGHSIPTSCDTLAMDPIGYHGEMEDYKVKIVPPSTAISGVTQAANSTAIFPNPTTGLVSVVFGSMEDNPMSIDLFDITGKLIGNLLGHQTQSSLTYSFDLNKVAASPGVYFIRVSLGGGTTYHKVVKAD